MKKILLIVSMIIFLSGFASSQVKLIFDTDFGGDADDLGALAMLHHYIDRGECELLAIMCWSLEKHAVSGIDAVNTYYKHPDILIGTRKDTLFVNEWHHGKIIADRFSYDMTYEKAPDATKLYRELLAKNDDKSVVIVTVGPLMNIKNLILSEPDSFSPLTGKELIEKKVKEFVIMGGKYPQGKSEWNFDGRMKGITKFVLENIHVPITFSGAELGNIIKSGKSLNNTDKNTPLYVGYMFFSEHAPWVNQNFKGMILDNGSYDQTAVLYAVKNGLGLYWDKVENGYCKADETGGNKWVKGKDKNHSYLKLIMDPEKMSKIIESIMLNGHDDND